MQPQWAELFYQATTFGHTSVMTMLQFVHIVLLVKNDDNQNKDKVNMTSHFPLWNNNNKKTLKTFRNKQANKNHSLTSDKGTTDRSKEWQPSACCMPQIVMLCDGLSMSVKAQVVHYSRNRFKLKRPSCGWVKPWSEQWTLYPIGLNWLFSLTRPYHHHLITKVLHSNNRWRPSSTTVVWGWCASRWVVARACARVRVCFGRFCWHVTASNFTFKE